MSHSTFNFTASDGHGVFCYRWLPAGQPRAIIHLAHGMGEHSGRYHWTAEQLSKAGYAVYMDDHRGHGRTATTLGDFGDDGWNRALADLLEMNQQYAKDYPGVPVVLFGHSMGSMLAEQYIALYGNTLAAVVISGSPGFANPVLSWILRLICRFEAWRLGPLKESAVLQNVIFGSANKAFEVGIENANGFEWLSRDSDQVQTYVDDPLCGFVPFAASLKHIFDGAAWTQRKASVAQIPTHLPLYLFSGSADPVHNEMRDMNRLLERYQQAGLSVQTRFYPDGRHEMLNETNRVEVVHDTLAWLNAQFPAVVAS
ncbi:MAG: alpha-beta hydrolase superfamily lysophospholipase [Candidatus Azotimanducaceae bacterium]|jgi:alpha-beta hydrolase superfamily lysophospholipase